MHTELKPGHVITGRRVNFNRGRIAAATLLGLACSFGLARTGTTVTTTGITQKPAVVCGVMGCEGYGSIKSGNPHGGGGGGGTIHVGS